MINPQPVNGGRTPYGQASPNPASPPARSANAPRPTPPAPRKKRWKKVLFSLFSALLVGGGTYATATYLSFRNHVITPSSKHAAILDYDPNDKNSTFNTADFTQIGAGRFTMVLVGVDKAAGLTDSIQVISIDTINKKSTITSIPRDLFVDVAGHGRAKINTVYKFAELDSKGSGAQALKDTIGSILNTPITNYALIDFNGLQALVDAVGGIDVDVPKAINDPFFPETTGDGYSPFYIKAGLQHLDGKTALRYARSRETTSDFDRSGRQQIIMEALRKKLLSAGVLTNPIKLNNILTAIESNFKTDVQIDQLKKLFSIYSSINDTSKANYVLDTTTELGLLTSLTDPSAGYISYPILGIGKYDAIQRWYRKNNPDPLLARETPTVTVTGTSKATTKQLEDVVTTLNDYGYTATLSTERVSSSLAARTTTGLYQTTQGKDKTVSKNYLASQFAAEPQSGNPLNSTSDFELIYSPVASKTTTKASPSPSASSSDTTSPAVLNLP